MKMRIALKKHLKELNEYIRRTKDPAFDEDNKTYRLRSECGYSPGLVVRAKNLQTAKEQFKKMAPSGVYIIRELRHGSWREVRCSF